VRTFPEHDSGAPDHVGLDFGVGAGLIGVAVPGVVDQEDRAGDPVAAELDHAPSDQIRTAITTAFTSSALRNGARHMASALAACGGASAAADEVGESARRGATLASASTRANTAGLHCAT
jgi:hypothetical protein